MDKIGIVAIAVQPDEVLDDPALEQRARELSAKMRCVVCQNQSLADSDAQLAHDLRKELYDMVVANKGDEEIKSFLVDRYGEFVLYRPPLRADTVFLWVAPILFLGIGAVVALVAAAVATGVGLVAFRSVPSETSPSPMLWLLPALALRVERLVQASPLLSRRL